MIESVCYIVGAGDFEKKKFNPRKNDFIIAADGGYMHLKEIGVKPNIVIGDFDSTSKPDHENILSLNQIKDDTDMMIAAKYALSLGYRKFEIFGGTGGRVSHTMANFGVLVFLRLNGCFGRVVGIGMTAVAVINSSIYFNSSMKGYISVMPVGVAHGVFERGLKYSLSNATLLPENPIGVSNEFVGTKSSVGVTDGTVIIILEDKKA